MPSCTARAGNYPSRRLRERAAYVVAIWFGCGLVPRAPGTAGTLGALPLYLAVRPFGLGALAATTVIVTAVAIWAAGVTERRLGVHDPQIVCVDEVAGVLLPLLASPVGWRGTLLAVVLFRICDQLKPWPAGLVDRRVGGGLGIVGDDLVAGVWATAGIVLLRLVGWTG